MPESRLSRLLRPLTVLQIAVALIMFAVFVDPISDPDLWWHIKVGNVIIAQHSVPNTELFSYTAAGNPWVLHQWGFEVLIAALTAVGGLLLTTVVVSVLSWTGLIAVALRMRNRGTGAIWVAVAIFVTAETARPILGTRVAGLTFALTCWVLFLAERFLLRGGRAIWLLVPLFAVWANIHAAFLAGLAFVGLILAVETARTIIHRRDSAAAIHPSRLRTLALVLGVSAMATCINPDGPGLYGYVLGSTSWLSHVPIVEWQHPDFSNPGLIWLLLLMVTTPVLLIVRRRRVSLTDAALALVGVAAAWWAARNVGIAAAVAAPVWVTLLMPAQNSPSPSRLSKGPMSPAKARAFGATILLVCAVSDGAAVAYAANAVSAKAVASQYPTCVSKTLGRASAPINVFAPYVVSDYLVGTAPPPVHVFEYGEVVSLGQSVFERYIRVLNGATADPSATTILDRTHTDIVVTPDGTLNDLMTRSTAWQLSLSEDGFHLYIRAAGGTKLVKGC